MKMPNSKNRALPKAGQILKPEKFRIAICIAGFWLLIFGASFAADFAYNPKGKRDPFIAIVGAAAAYQSKEPMDINAIGDVRLEGIIYGGKGGSIVILNGSTLREGEKVGVVTIEKIEPKKVILFIREERCELSLGQEEGGR